MSKTVKRSLAAAAILAFAGALLLFVAVVTFRRSFEPEIRRQVVAYLEKRFHANVSLESLRIDLPGISPVRLLIGRGRGSFARVEGTNLTVRPAGRGDLPPIFSASSLAFAVDLGMLRAARPEIANVTLKGMTIVIPPKDDRPAMEKQNVGSANVEIDRVDIFNARLIVLPKAVPNAPERKPLDFALEEIHLTSAGPGQRMNYEAVIRNPRPPGLIRSHGVFGPWKSDNPGDTALEGDYDFANADLSVFSGIAGTLHSSGHFGGTLSAVRARGEATVPDFRLKSSGNRVPLETHYDVIVDGTNGNTILQPVEARLGETAFQTSGGIIKHEAGGRRAIDLSVAMAAGRVEDLLSLAVKGKPFMSGLIRMQAKISIPPLGGSVKEKLKLDGTFDIDRGEFLREAVQDKVDELSRRGQGRPADESIEGVFSHMSGAFGMQDEVMSFRRLSFAVSGAQVGMHGEYRMAQDTLDFHGDLKLEARVSQTLEGWKRWLAKPLDPFFARHGAGTFLKIQVVGSARKPEFGLDHGQ